MKTLLFIRPLPTESIPAPWAKALHPIDQPTPFPPLTQPILRMRLDMEEADWRVALYWVVKKKWNSKLKLPLKRKQATLYEPRGELLFRALGGRLREWKKSYAKSSTWGLGSNGTVNALKRSQILFDSALKHCE